MEKGNLLNTNLTAAIKTRSKNTSVNPWLRMTGLATNFEKVDES
jgi:hypothetical protein